MTICYAKALTPRDPYNLTIYFLGHKTNLVYHILDIPFWFILMCRFCLAEIKPYEGVLM